MNDSEQLLDNVKTLTMNKIRASLPLHTFSQAEKHTQAKMEEAVTQLPGRLQLNIIEAAHNKKRMKELTMLNTTHTPPCNQSPVDESDFMKPVPDDCRKECITNFIKATGHEATSTSTCASCSGRFTNKEIVDKTIFALQEAKTLVPLTSHPAHVLTHGMLLYRSPQLLFVNEDGTEMAHICQLCMTSLNRKEIPAFSLANRMWIGDVPLELRILTLPERILVA